MIVEQPEAFKNWLSAVLKNMCEADPEALAKYVIALTKKDKPEAELRKSMIAQLEVFLEEETEQFVGLVFKTLLSQEYLKTPIIPNTNPPNPNIILEKDKENIKDKIIIPPNELPNLSEQFNGLPKSDIIKKDKDIKDIKDLKKPDVDNKDKNIRSRRDSRDRIRSRSRSWDRTNRSRSRDKSRERERSPLYRSGSDRDKRDRQPRAWRNKSPPLRSIRYERRRSRSPLSPNCRSRSPRRSNRYKNRSTDRSRSRSRSLDKNRRDNLKLDSAGIENNSHGDSDMRVPFNVQNMQNSLSSQAKRRCRDFDEKGYCMRGEMCPFDHGVDPVVLEDTSLTRVLTFNPNGNGTEMPPNIPPPIPGAAGHMMLGPRAPFPSEYNPQAPFLRGYRGPRPLGPVRPPGVGIFAPHPNMNRELISVPVMDNEKNSYSPPFASQGNKFQGDKHNTFYQQKKGKFDYNRLGRPMKNNANCSLELKKIPVGLNSITHLNNHFSKFGTITNIQVNYEGDSEAAIITFSSHAEATAAYRSTEAVLNNRFIKVFWHNLNNDSKQENIPPKPVKERLGIIQNNSNNNKMINSVEPMIDDTNKNPVIDGNIENKDDLGISNENKEDTKAQATAAIKKNQEYLAAKEKLKKNQDEQRKEVMKIKQDLRKRKQELLEKQLSQQKILIEKMEKLPAGPQRDVIMQTIKKTQESIEEIRKDIAHSTLIAKTAVSQRKAKEDAQKEMLDIELELITKEQEGADTTEIQKKYTELKAKTSMLKPRGRGRRFNPIQRHLLSKNNVSDNSVLLYAGVKSSTKIDRTNSNTNLNANYVKATPTHSVDHRPTRILVSGYEIEEEESVVSHFQQFGEVIEYVTDSALPSVTFSYKVRKDAETALLKGRHFEDRTLSITWCSNAQLSNQMNNSRTTKKVTMTEFEEDRLIEVEDEMNSSNNHEIAEEILLQDEDDDDDEDRSWRR